MTCNRSLLRCLSAFLALALALSPGCDGFGPAPAAGTSLRIGCDNSCSCSPYEGCVSEGVVWCERNTCYTNGTTDLSCVDAIDRVCTPSSAPARDAGTSPSLLCSTVPAPIEQVRQVPDRTQCWFGELRPDGNGFEFGWVVAVADSPYGTIEIVRANVLGVRHDGTIVPIRGSALGQRQLTFAGLYTRSPWFVDDSFTRLDIPSGSTLTFPVPTDQVLHLVLGGEDVSGYREAYMMVEARTTGDVRYQVGLDYDSNATVERGEVRPVSGHSDWARCTNGDTFTVSSPISTDRTFCGYRPIVPSTAPPPPTGSWDFVFEPGPLFRTTDTSSPGYCPGGWITTVWAGTRSEDLISTPGGAIRSSAPLSWPSVSAITMECPSLGRWMNWSRWAGRPVSEISGFGTLTVCGSDIRPLVNVEGGDNAKPIISWHVVRGPC